MKRRKAKKVRKESKNRLMHDVQKESEVEKLCGKGKFL